jgi:ABC-type nitrate/sulfonate/bicarbonate transport system substrate-binding protein
MVRWRLASASPTWPIGRKTGTGLWEGQPAVEKLRLIANLYPESIHLVARKDAGIASVADLKGKKVSLDEPGSGMLVLIAPELVSTLIGVAILPLIVLRQALAGRAPALVVQSTITEHPPAMGVEGA